MSKTINTVVCSCTRRACLVTRQEAVLCWLNKARINHDCLMLYNSYPLVNQCILIRV